ncbi:MAG: polysaccharide lyase family 8 super-sandwich domain-containing protein [Phycisphaeraceae bacterium]
MNATTSRAITIGFVIACLTAPASAAIQDEMALVKQRVVTLLRGGEPAAGDPAGDSRYVRSVRVADARRDQFMDDEPMRIVWDDPDDREAPERINHFAGRLRTLAEGYRTPTSRLHGSDAVRERIFAGLEHLLEHFNPDTSRPGNWHPWLISIPSNVGAIALLMEDELPADLRQALETSLTHELQEMVLDGANAASEARNHMYLALLQGDAERLNRAAEHAIDAVTYSTAVGVREDYSYLYHGHIPYAGVYGAGFAHRAAQFMYLFDGTRWAASPAQRELIANLLLEHSRWFVMGPHLDLHVAGRTYARQRSTGSLASAMVLMSRVATSRQAEMGPAASAVLREGASVSTELAAIADELEATEPNPPRGFRFWYASELGAYRSDDYHVGWRQFSTRIQDYEHLEFFRVGGEGGWNLAYGFTNILRDGEEWYADNALHPGIDMNYLPGTTSRVDAHPEADPWTPEASGIGHSLNYGTAALSGGAGWREGGVSGFVLQPVHGNFTAHKSLHFFPGGFWALGSAITVDDAASHNGQPVNTTVLQWVVGDSDAALQLSGNRRVEPGQDTTVLEDVRWAWIDNIACIFAEPTRIHARYVDGVVRLWLDHGVNPRDEAYAYAVLPNASLAEAREFADQATVAPTAHQPHVHTVHDPRRGAESMMFFAAGRSQDVEVDRPTAVYRRRHGDEIALAVQNPMHDGSVIELTMDPPAEIVHADDGIAFGAADDTGRQRFTIDTTLGRIYRLGGGELGRQIGPVPREDLAAFHTFDVQVDSNATQTILTAHIPLEAVEAGYELTLHGFKGHMLHRFDETDIMDRPSENLVRYRWDRALNEAHEPTHSSNQRAGDFRLILRAPMKAARAYFTVPAFNDEGEVQPDAELPVDADNPRRD